MIETGLLKRHTTFFLLVFTLAAAIAAPSARAQEKHPFAGTWNANLSKSQRHENHQFKSATMKFEISDDVVTVTFAGVNMAGKQELGVRKLHPDGKEYPVAEAAGFVEISKWLDTHRLETVAKKDGNINGQSLYEVSRDGKTLTATLKGVDGKGRPFEQIIVFDKE